MKGKNADVVNQFITISILVLIATLIMVGVYAILGKLSREVIAGAISGLLADIIYFIMLSIQVSNLTDKAINDAEFGSKASDKALPTISASSRLFVIGAILFVILYSGKADPFATLIPLLFIRPAIIIFGFLKREKPTDSQ